MIESLHKAERPTGYSKKFWLLMSVFYLLFVIRNLIGLSFPVEIFLILVTLMACLFDEEEIVALVVSFIPLYPAFQNKIAILLCLAVLIIKCYRQIKILPFTLAGVLLILWEFFHHNIGTFSFVEGFASFAELIFVMVLACIQRKKTTNMVALSRVYGITCIVCFVILLANTFQVTHMNFFQLLGSGYRLGELKALESLGYQFSYNPNGLGFICNLGIGILLLNFYHKKGNLLDALMIVVMLFIGTLTVSRTFLILFALTVILFIMLQNVDFFKRLRSIFLLFVALGMVLLLIYALFPNIFLNYLERFMVEDVTNGRSYLSDFYNSFIFSSFDRLFFGVGMQDIVGKMRLFENIDILCPHNGYQEIVVAWGIPGLILMGIFMSGIVMSAMKKRATKKIEWTHFMVLLLLLVNIIAGQFFTSSFRMISLVLVYESVKS